MLRPVRRPIVAVLAVAGVCCGCGGGPTDTEQVHDVVTAFGQASAAKDYQRLCDDLLAPKLVSDVESAGLPCELALKQGLGEVAAARLTIGTVRVPCSTGPTVEAPGAKMTSGASAINSAAYLRISFASPADQRTSIRMLPPSVQPS